MPESSTAYTPLLLLVLLLLRNKIRIGRCQV